MNMSKTNKDVTENFYDHDKIKKYLPKIKDEQVKLTGMPVTQHILMAGSTGANKSNMLLNYIKRSSGTYTKIFMLIKKLEAFNLLLKEILGDAIEFHFDMNTFPDVSQFKDLGKKNNDLYLVVFDDFISTNDKKSIKKMEDYLIYGRSKGVTCILLTQSYFQTPILLRKQVSWVFLCGIKGKRDLKAILNEYSMGDVDTDTLKRMYDYCKLASYPSEPTAMKINTGVCDINKKFSRNFLEYIDPRDFEKSKSESDYTDEDDNIIKFFKN